MTMSLSLSTTVRQRLSYSSRRDKYAYGRTASFVKSSAFTIVILHPLCPPVLESIGLGRDLGGDKR